MSFSSLNVFMIQKDDECRISNMDDVLDCISFIEDDIAEYFAEQLSNHPDINPSDVEDLEIDLRIRDEAVEENAVRIHFLFLMNRELEDDEKEFESLCVIEPEEAFLVKNTKQFFKIVDEKVKSLLDKAIKVLTTNKKDWDSFSFE